MALAPAPASAVTIDEVLSLAKAGVSDQTIIAMIDRDQTIFTIDAAELLTLKSAGVSEPVLRAMLRSGRHPAPAAPAAQAAEPILPPPADMVVVGHEPDLPDLPYTRGAYGDTGAAYGTVVVVPYPVFAPVFLHAFHGQVDRRTLSVLASPALPDSRIPLSPFHVGPELPPSPFHVGPTFPPFVAVKPRH